MFPGREAVGRVRARLTCPTNFAPRPCGPVYREARSGKIETADASRLSFMLQGIAKMIEAATIERRIEALEAPTKRIAQSSDYADAEVISNE